MTCVGAQGSQHSTASASIIVASISLSALSQRHCLTLPIPPLDPSRARSKHQGHLLYPTGIPALCHTTRRHSAASKHTAGTAFLHRRRFRSEFQAHLPRATQARLRRPPSQTRSQPTQTIAVLLLPIPAITEYCSPHLLHPFGQQNHRLAARIPDCHFCLCPPVR